MDFVITYSKAKIEVDRLFLLKTHEYMYFILFISLSLSPAT